MVIGTPWCPLVPLGSYLLPLVPLGDPSFPLGPLGTPFSPLDQRLSRNTTKRKIFFDVDKIETQKREQSSVTFINIKPQQNDQSYVMFINKFPKIHQK